MNAGREEAFHNHHASNPAAKLDLRAWNRSCDAARDLHVSRLAFECPVEIHDVQPFCALGRPLGRHFDGIAVDCRLVLAALYEPHSLTAKNVDCRINPHRRAKLSRSRSPTCWLFYGWNCVAQMFLQCTTAGNSIS